MLTNRPNFRAGMPGFPLWADETGLRQGLMLSLGASPVPQACVSGRPCSQGRGCLYDVGRPLLPHAISGTQAVSYQLAG